MPARSLGQWVTTTAPLIESHWCLVSGAWADILANVTRFTVRIDLVFDDDITGIDNVVLAGTGAVTCPADLNYDGIVGIEDFIRLLATWGAFCWDVDGDGVMGITDFLELLSQWGPCL